MGQKTHPTGLRLGITTTWSSRWHADRRDYTKFLHEDFSIRAYLSRFSRSAGISNILIERMHKRCNVTVHAARPGVLIGKKGADIEKLRKAVVALIDDDVRLNIVEVRKPEVDAELVAQGIATQLERRASFRRVMKRSMAAALRMGALGIRIECSGRLGGAEIASAEWYREGRVPLHTLRADIDYAMSEAFTTYGVCGIKVWIYKQEIFDKNYLFGDSSVSVDSNSKEPTQSGASVG